MLFSLYFIWYLYSTGWLATGDNTGSIYVSEPTNSGWATRKSAFVGHTSSAEDIQWSSNEGNVSPLMQLKGKMIIFAAVSQSD